MDANSLVKQIDKDSIVKLASDLISIPSFYDTPGYEKQVNEYIGNWLSDRKLDTSVIQLHDSPMVVARIKGSGSGYSLMLNGHTDTESNKNMPNASTPIVEKNHLHGRGSVDMKGSVASMMHVLEIIRRNYIELKGDIVFAAVTGEEGRDSPGSRYIAKNGPRTDFAIVGEPSGNIAGLAHPGLCAFKVRIDGVWAHSSSPKKGLSAIEAGIYLSDRLKRLRNDWLICSIEGGEIGSYGKVPGVCNAIFEFRPESSDGYRSVARHLNRAVEETCGHYDGLKVSIDTIAKDYKPFLGDKKSHLVKSLSKAHRKIFRKDITYDRMSFWTDAAILQDAGICSVVYGPGESYLAHSDRESIEVQDLVKTAGVYLLTAMYICRDTHE